MLISTPISFECLHSGQLADMLLIFEFSLGSSNFVIGIKLCPFFNLKWHLTVHFGAKVCQTDPELTVIHLLVSFASKHQSPQKQQLVQLKTQNHKHVSMRQLSSFEMQHKCFMNTSYFVTWNLKKMYTKDFPGSPEVKISCFQGREWGFHPCLRN